MVYAPYGPDKQTWPTKADYLKELAEYTKSMKATGVISGTRAAKFIFDSQPNRGGQELINRHVEKFPGVPRFPTSLNAGKRRLSRRHNLR
jgi:hypothetical protein